MDSDPELDGMIMCVGEDKKTGVAEWLMGRMVDSRNAKPLVEKKHAKALAGKEPTTRALFDSPSMRIYLTIISRLCNFRITNISDSATNLRGFSYIEDHIGPTHWRCSADFSSS